LTPQKETSCHTFKLTTYFFKIILGVHEPYNQIKCRALIEKVDITQELKMAGNVTIFSPLNEAFDKLPIKIENQNLSSLRRLILRHFVKGFLFKRDMENGTIRTLGGELVRIMRQENNVKFLSKSAEANLRASNIETAFGLVQVIDSVLI